MKHNTNRSMKRALGTALAACCMAVTAIDPVALLTAEAAYSTGTYTVSGQSANIRQTPGEEVVGYASGGASFNVTTIDGSWGYSSSIPATSGKNLTGWVYLGNCTMAGTAPAPAAASYSVGSKVEVTNTDKVNFRTGAGTNHLLIGTIPQGTVLEVSEVSGGWIRVAYNGQNGWISTDYCKNYSGTVSDTTGSNKVAAVGDKVEITNTDAVNFRSGAGTGYSKLGTIPRGTVLKVEEVSGSWFRVTYNGKNGWISSGYCKKYVENIVENPTTNKVASVGDKVEIANADAVNFRTGAGTSYAKIGTIPRGTVVTVEEISGNWFRVNYNGKDGWFSSGYCKKYVESNVEPSTPSTPADGTKIKVTAAVAVYLRTGAGASYNLIGSVPGGAILTVIESKDGWYRVNYDGKTGWITSRYTEKYTETTPSTPSTPSTPVTPSQPTAIAAGDTVKITAAVAVNLRTGASTSFQSIGTIPRDAVVTVKEVSGGWCRTEYKGKSGWFVSQYCVKQTQNTPVVPDVPAVDEPEQEVSTSYKAGDSVKTICKVYLRSGTSKDFEAIDVIAKAAVLKVEEVSGEWIRVSWNGKTGWMCSLYCVKNTADQSETVTVSGKLTVNAAVSVNLRKEPNTSCAVIGYIKGGTVLEYTDKSNGWYKVIYNGKTGWISGTYAKLV